MTVYSNLKYDHPFSANATGTGALTKISSQTASSSATNEVSFDFNGSSDGGSNYNVT